MYSAYDSAICRWICTHVHVCCCTVHRARCRRMVHCMSHAAACVTAVRPSAYSRQRRRNVCDRSAHAIEQAGIDFQDQGVRSCPPQRRHRSARTPHARELRAVTRVHTYPPYLAEVVERYAESDALLAVRIHHLRGRRGANRCSDCATLQRVPHVAREGVQFARACARAQKC